MLPARPDVIDDDIPGQPEQPAPEGDAPQLVPRERLQGLDEDELRQVLRVARAADAGGDVAIDRPVVAVEERPECLRVTGLRRLHETFDRLVVDRHNEPWTPVLGLVALVRPALAPSGRGCARPPAERERVESGARRVTIRLPEPVCEPLCSVGVAADGHVSTAELPVARDDRRGRVRLARELPQPGRVDLERGTGFDQRVRARARTAPGAAARSAGITCGTR